MSYKSDQYQNAVKFKESLQDNEENEYIVTNKKGDQCEHFFKKTELNLWESIRADALRYFSAKKITWHINPIEKNPETIPQGDMLSSQISCVNHLFLLRKNQAYATAILKKIDSRIVSAEIVCDGYGDDGYIEFESWGTKENNNPLNEKSSKRKRGEKSTSVDAIMIGKKADGRTILFLIEWKYTEDDRDRDKCRYVYINGKEYNRPTYKDCIHSNECKKGIDCKYRATDKNEYHTYHKYFDDDKCPIKKDAEFEKTFIKFYFEPFYQLSRQTLWAWKVAKEFDCDEYIHLHIIPKENLKFRTIKLESKSCELSDVWRNLLKEPCRYKVLAPEEFLYPLYQLRKEYNLEEYFKYLYERYIEKYA